MLQSLLLSLLRAIADQQTAKPAAFKEVHLLMIS